MVEQKSAVSDFKAAFLASEEEDQRRNVSSGDLVQGEVVLVTKEDVVIDIGLKAECRVKLHEFTELGETPKKGDRVDVKIISMEQDDGTARISRRRAIQEGRWQVISDAFEAKSHVKGKIIEEVKGGFKVDLGLSFAAFLPRSQASIKRKINDAELIGQEFEFEIKEFNRHRKNIVLSRRALLEADVKAKREETLKNVQVGSIVEGVVKNITDFGVFVDIGGIDGLIMLGDLTWAGFVKDASKIAKKGEQIKVKVLEFHGDKEPPRIRLGLKQVQGEPWDNLPENVKPGVTIQGIVKTLTNFGAFIEIIPGVDGLAHISELSWTKHVKDPAELLQVGQAVSVKVVSVDPTNKKISLSVKDTSPDPWSQVLDEFPPGSRIRGAVTGVTNFGAFVRLPSGIEGMVHRTDLSWNEEIDDPAAVVKVGDEVDVVVLQLDVEQKKISLGLKQTQADPWQNVMRKFQKNHIVESVITKISGDGVFLELEGDAIGFIPRNELPREGAASEFKIVEGEKIRAKVLRLERKGKRVILSMRDLIRQEEAANLKDYMTEQKTQTGSITLGDLVADPETAKRLKEMLSRSES